jgi:PilZ domain-containing protein
VGKRREPRKPVALTVRIFGTDVEGHVFSENVSTVNISREGACVGAVKSKLKPGETVGVTCGSQKARFRVAWTGDPGTPAYGQVGLQHLTPDNNIWGTSLPMAGADTYSAGASATERRTRPRFKCVISVEILAHGEQSRIWGKVSDISDGGCFIEMPMPLKKGTRLKLVLWVKETKVQVDGTVSNSRPGFGMGIQFTELGEEARGQLKSFIASINRLAF